MNNNIRFFLAAILLPLAARSVPGQTIDDVEVRDEGANAVVQVRFATEVQLVRAVTPRSGDVTLVFYELVGTTNQSLPRSALGRRIGGSGGLPRIDIEDEADRGERSRRMVVRFDAPTPLRVRAGKGNRSIELVLDGLGAAVRAPIAAAPRRPVAETAAPVVSTPSVPIAPPPPTPVPVERHFFISLQRSDTPTIELGRAVPRALQDYEVFSSQRVVDGKTLYELDLGYFATREEAERALRLLSGFSQATIVALAPAAAPLTAAVSAPIPAPAAAASVPAQVAAASVPVIAAAPVAAPIAAQPAASVDVETQAAGLLAAAREAYSKQDFPAALERLNALLELPPNAGSREAQELAGLTRARSGDVARARVEFETYLRLYPQGDAVARVRNELAALPQPAAPVTAAAGKPATETTTSGSASLYHYGGNGKIRSQDFKDSPINGLPEVAGDPTLSADKIRQMYADVDLNWRQRDADHDMRLVFRDAYTADLERSDKNKNRLSAAYLDYKSLIDGYSVRLGRQSPTGGGVLGRFDGAQASYTIAPKWKVAAVAGVPSEPLFDTQRHFYGVSLDSEALLPNLGAAVYAIQQMIDGEIDRRALGLELRYFRNGASVFSQFDYDTVIRGLNIATVQGTLLLEDNTVFTALYDRRALTLLALGNALTFEDPANPGLVTNIRDRLSNTTLELLRQQIKATTPFVTQAQVSFTTPVTKQWQIGGNGQLTNTGAIPPVAGVVGFETGRPATGNIYTVGAQLIGLNLYSSRDTHVLAASLIRSPEVHGRLVSYNNSSFAFEAWQVEPSLQYYADSNPQGGHSERWTPGLRLTWRGWKRWAVESNVSWELGKSFRIDPSDPTKTTQENANRVNYSLGARYEF